MEIIKLQTSAAPHYQQALTLYRSSFPWHEQREEASQLRILSHPEYCFGLIREADAFIGLMLYWENEMFRYVEHFCILPELRGQGYGHRALARLCADQKPVILEIDPPTDEISRRRRTFYERTGFNSNPYAHVHPPYHTGHAGHELVVMSRPGVLTEDLYLAFSDYLTKTVMESAFD